MNKTCVICGMVFDAKTKAKSCSFICRRAAHRKNVRRFYAANSTKIKESKRRYLAANSAKIKESKRRFRAVHPEKAGEYQRRFYANHPEKAGEYKLRYRVRHSEIFREQHLAQRRRRRKEKLFTTLLSLPGAIRETISQQLTSTNNEHANQHP